jgi:hypothetical protein
VAEALTDASDDAIREGFPLPVAHGARSCSPGWLADIARRGQGGNDRDCSGVRRMLVLKQHGVATGWALASGHGQERWVAERLCRTRAGLPRVQGPLEGQPHQPTVPPPTAWRAVLPSGGAVAHKPLLSASGFRGEEWLTHWATAYAAHVCPRSTAAPGAQRRWWSAARQVVATTFANVSESVGLKYPDAHTGWGLLMRVAAKVAAYNLGIVLKRLFGRPDFAFATLIV